ncbi:MAG: hypothetical protein ILP16_00360 [Spirochaetales bacterium]|nr:hypothetical protein [Spirochaetales bacterium]
MRKLSFVLIIILVLVLCSCATVSNGASERFSLERSGKTASSAGLLMGTVSYGASGFYFPTSSDILDISLLKTDATTGLVTEISHQRLRNFQKFPIQFTVRYDNADLSQEDSCTLIVTLIIDDVVKGQGITLLQRTDAGFADASLTLLSV